VSPSEKARDARRLAILRAHIDEKRKELARAWLGLSTRRVHALSESIQSAIQECGQILRRWPELREGAGDGGPSPGEASSSPPVADGTSVVHHPTYPASGPPPSPPKPSPGSEATPPQPCRVCGTFHTEGLAKNPITGCDVPDRR
jgi:hypothetical protein